MSENKIATKADLQRMYNKMLPYLGGMPEMVANKFSKGDLYSTEERMIGQWIDGKPIYQKTITDIIPTTTEDGTETSGDFNIGTNIDNVIKVDAFAVLSIGIFQPIYTGTTSNGVHKYIRYFIRNEYALDDSIKNKFRISNAWAPLSGESFYATIQYTKTTDSSISIASDTDYSTEEKIVGTWIDGRPLYQKTVSTGGSEPSGATLIQRIAMASTGYDTIKYTKTS